MKFLIDAQLPKLLTSLLRELGHDALHTLDLLAYAVCVSASLPDLKHRCLFRPPWLAQPDADKKQNAANNKRTNPPRLIP